MDKPPLYRLDPDGTVSLAGFEWLPIHSAPRNEPVLVFEPNAEPQIVCAKLVDNHLGKWWEYCDEIIQSAAPEGPQASHWMPLPASPTVSS